MSTRWGLLVIVVSAKLGIFESRRSWDINNINKELGSLGFLLILIISEIDYVSLQTLGRRTFSDFAGLQILEEFKNSLLETIDKIDEKIFERKCQKHVDTEDRSSGEPSWKGWLACEIRDSRYLCPLRVMQVSRKRDEDR